MLRNPFKIVGNATNHTLRKIELRGLLHPIRLSARTLRYDIRDIERLIEDARAN